MTLMFSSDVFFYVFVHSYVRICFMCCLFLFFFFKQKTAYEMRISDWSSDVCSSDLAEQGDRGDRSGRRRADRREQRQPRGRPRRAPEGGGRRVIAAVEAWRAGLMRRGNLLPNIIAGVIVGVVALPLAMAFAIVSGVKPEQGLYTAIIEIGRANV